MRLSRVLGYVFLVLHYLLVVAKALLAVALSPLLILLLFTWDKAFLAIMSALWVHLTILGPNKEKYLRRFFMTPKTQWFCPRFLHHIAVSDEGRDPHDHPGPFSTTILRGGYVESVYLPRVGTSRDSLCKVHTVRAGMTQHNDAGHTHMVTLLGPTISWVKAWKRGKPWGFWKMHPTDPQQDHWVESEEYGVKGDEVASWTVPAWIQYLINEGAYK